MAFYVGQKVIFIDDNWDYCMRTYKEYWPNLPIKGCVYTIRQITDNGPLYDHGLMLCEIHNPIKKFSTGIGEGNFKAIRFKPLIERKTDISIFKEMLNPVKNKSKVSLRR